MFDYTKLESLDLSNQDDLKKLIGAIKFQMGKFNLFKNPWDSQDAGKKKTQFMKSPHQFLTLSTDFPSVDHETILKHYETPPIPDTGWLLAFKFKDMTGIRKSGVKLKTIKDGLTFEKIPKGGKVRYFGFEGTEIVLSFQRYGTGLKLDADIFEDGEWLSLEEAIELYRGKHAKLYPEIAYGLMEAISTDFDILFEPPSPTSLPESHENYQLIRIIQTLNKAGLELKEYAHQKGYEVPFIPVFCPGALFNKVKAAIKLHYLNGDTAFRSNYNFIPVETMYFKNTDSVYPCIPYNKTGGAQKLNLKLFDRFDSDSYSFKIPGWLRFVMWIGDQGQFRRCKLTD
ncbi:MAG: hypothetical protein KAW12_07225 [Candidatus Aminicenantes bacterium]|nr:hypothetical protein [Candidatus Aminicenantes bacterium]